MVKGSHPALCRKERERLGKVSCIQKEETVGVRQPIFPEDAVGNGRHHAEKCPAPDPPLTGRNAYRLASKVSEAQPLETVVPDVVVVEAWRKILDAPGDDVALDRMTSSRGWARLRSTSLP